MEPNRLTIFTVVITKLNISNTTSSMHRIGATGKNPSIALVIFAFLVWLPFARPAHRVWAGQRYPKLDTVGFTNSSGPICCNHPHEAHMEPQLTPRDSALVGTPRQCPCSHVWEADAHTMMRLGQLRDREIRLQTLNLSGLLPMPARSLCLLLHKGICMPCQAKSCTQRPSCGTSEHRSGITTILTTRAFCSTILQAGHDHWSLIDSHTQQPNAPLQPYPNNAKNLDTPSLSMCSRSWTSWEWILTYCRMHAHHVHSMASMKHYV